MSLSQITYRAGWQAAPFLYFWLPEGCENFTAPPYIALVAWTLFILFTQLLPQTTLWCLAGCKFWLALLFGQGHIELAWPAHCSTLHLQLLTQLCSPCAPVAMSPRSLWVPHMEATSHFLCLRLSHILWMWLATSTLTSICLLFFMYLFKTNKDLRR